MLKCPSCGSSLRFDIPSQKLHCDYCSGSFEPDIFDSVTKDAELQEGFGNAKLGENGLYETAVWTCPGCGAVVTYTDDTDITSVCPYCGGRNIIFERIRGERRPDSIVPFKITKEECAKRYRAQARKAFLSPGRLHRDAQIESFRGIYMPYFDYYANVDEDVSVSITNRNAAQSSGSTDAYDVHELDAHVKGKVFGSSHDASVRFSDDISESLGEFEGSRPFTPGYLCGFYAEADNAGADTHKPTPQEVKDKIRLAVADEITHCGASDGGVNASSGTYDKSSIEIKSKDIYAERSLYPVWFMSSRLKNGKLTYAAVNGSTGKVSADFPLSFIKVLLFALGAAGAFFLLFNLVGLMPRPKPSLGISMMLFMVGCVLMSHFFMKKIERLSTSYSGIIGIMRWLMIFMWLFMIFPILLFLEDTDAKWEVFIIFTRLFFVGERTFTMIKTCKLINRIDMEEARLSWGDIRFARAIALIYLIVPTLFSLVSMILLLVDRPNEGYYYTAAANAVVLMGLFVFNLLVINYFSYRRPPQFSKKGGDDSAE